MIEEGLIVFAMADSGITDLIGDHLYPEAALPDAAAPYVVFTTLSDVPGYSHQGDTGPRSVRVQFDIYAETYASVVAVGRAFEARFSGYRGAMGSAAVGSCMLVHSTGLPPEAVTGLYRRVLDFRVHYN